MNDREIRISQMGVRMKDFGEAQAASFPAASRGGQKFAALNTLVAEVDRLGAEQIATASAAQADTQAKQAAREKIRRLMKAMRDTSVSLEPEHPGISKNFRMPPTNGDEALINSARAFVDVGTPLKSLFTSSELPASFLEDLTAVIGEFETFASNYNQRRAENAAATASLRDALASVARLKAELDPIVRNKFRDNPAMIAAWERASRIERAPKRARPEAEATPAQP